METKHLTILHSNDMHGDFLPGIRDGRKTGGLALLSGYVKESRKRDRNVLYAIAGDVFQGSIDHRSGIPWHFHD